MKTQPRNAISSALTYFALNLAFVSVLVPISNIASAEPKEWSAASNRPWITRDGDEGTVRKSPLNVADRPWMDDSDGKRKKGPPALTAKYLRRPWLDGDDRKKSPTTASSGFSQMVTAAMQCQNSSGFNRACFDDKAVWVPKSVNSKDLSTIAELALIYQGLGITRIPDRLAANSAREQDVLAGELAKLPRISVNGARKFAQVIARLRDAADHSLQVASLPPQGQPQDRPDSESDAGR